MSSIIRNMPWYMCFHIINIWYLCIKKTFTCLFTGALNLTHEEFHSRVAPTAITSVACVGTEDELISCSYSHLTTCGLLNDAGVICQGIRIIF